MTHDVVSLYEKLEQDYGIDAVRLNTRRSTSTIQMIGTDGLPVNVGWFEDVNKPGVPGGAVNTYALTSTAPTAETIDHRIIIGQMSSGENGASIREEDSGWFMEGIDDAPIVLSSQDVIQPTLGLVIKGMTEGAMVLRVKQADEFAASCRQLSVNALRSHGLALREQQIGLGFVNL